MGSTNVAKAQVVVMSFNRTVALQSERVTNKPVSCGSHAKRNRLPGLRYWMQIALIVGA